MESIPLELVNFIQQLRPLFRAEVFESFQYLLIGLLIGEAKYGTVRASVFAPADYQPQRLSDLFCQHKLSHQAFMARLVEISLALLYPSGLPARLFWIADATNTEKPYAERIASIGLFHRTKKVAGRAKHLKGHCYVFAAHLYRITSNKVQKWASVLMGALLYVKGRTIPALVGELAGQLRLPRTVRNVWLVDRGIAARTLLRALATLNQYLLGRMRCNQIVYFAPRRRARRGRHRQYGQGCRVDQLITRFIERLQCQDLPLRVRGRERNCLVFSAQVLLRGVFKGYPLPVRVIIIVVPELDLQPWYLLTTDLELDVLEAVRAYDGRYQIEVNFDEVKELGLAYYMGRSGQGVRRWPLFLSLVQTILKFVATSIIPISLPSLNWSWYDNENTVGQIRRRLIAFCQPVISRTLAVSATAKK